MNNITFRNPTPSDLNFIRSSWRNSFADGPWCNHPKTNVPLEGIVEYRGKPVFQEARHLLQSVYDMEHEEIMSRLIIHSMHNYGIKLAVKDDVILGWACTDGSDVVHFIYVKKDFRRQGLASLLLKELGFSADKPTAFTHRTRVSDNLCHRNGPLHSWFYNPYIGFRIAYINNPFGDIQ